MSSTFASRGGLKLQHALAAFNLNITGLSAADFGCSTGGFTDCLLKAGATRVYAVDTAYGLLAWTLRNDSRVTVMERTNALHAPPPTNAVGSPSPIDLVVADLSWTPQRLLIPAALKWLKPTGRIITLVKPHYETKEVGAPEVPRGGVLDGPEAERVAMLVKDRLPSFGVRVDGFTKSPILGGAGKSGKGSGNVEYLALLTRV
jgi:23S rRNA (cytidine1920-2'-O)/16S rRNA (cytidine1409-2'-O)-methyltransferase